MHFTFSAELKLWWLCFAKKGFSVNSPLNPSSLLFPLGSTTVTSSRTLTCTQTSRTGRGSRTTRSQTWRVWGRARRVTVTRQNARMTPTLTLTPTRPCGRLRTWSSPTRSWERWGMIMSVVSTAGSYWSGGLSVLCINASDWTSDVRIFHQGKFDSVTLKRISLICYFLRFKASENILKRKQVAFLWTQWEHLINLGLKWGRVRWYWELNEFNPTHLNQRGAGGGCLNWSHRHPGSSCRWGLTALLKASSGIWTSNLAQRC